MEISKNLNREEIEKKANSLGNCETRDARSQT